jgi:hypothetical protein
LEILIIWHLRRVFPRPEVTLFITKSFLSELDLGDMFRQASKIIYTLTVVVSPDPMSPAPSSSSALKTPESTEEDPDGDNQMEYRADQLYSPSI